MMAKFEAMVWLTVEALDEEEAYYLVEGALGNLVSSGPIVKFEIDGVDETGAP